MFEFGQEAGSGVLPVGDDQRGVRVHALTGDVAVTGCQVGGVSGSVIDRTVVRLTGPCLSRCWGLAGGVGLTGSPGGTFGSEVGEGGGVVAGAGGEVASEAEHVGPLPQSEVGVPAVGGEVPGGVDHAAGVVGDVVGGELGEEAEAAVEGAGGGLGALGGVLGDVGGDVPLGDRAAAGEVRTADRWDDGPRRGAGTSAGRGRSADGRPSWPRRGPGVGRRRAGSLTRRAGRPWACVQIFSTRFKAGPARRSWPPSPTSPPFNREASYAAGGEPPRQPGVIQGCRSGNLPGRRADRNWAPGGASCRLRPSYGRIAGTGPTRGPTLLVRRRAHRGRWPASPPTGSRPPTARRWRLTACGGPRAENL